jgi:serine/threonine protein kinase
MQTLANSITTGGSSDKGEFSWFCPIYTNYYFRIRGCFRGPLLTVQLFSILLYTAVPTEYVIAGVVPGLLLVLVIVSTVSVFLIYHWRKTKQLRTQPRSSRGSRGPDFMNSAEDEPPFQLGHLVSRGRYGYVYRTEYEGKLVAVKVFSYQNHLSWENERTLFGMQSTKHRNVIDYIVGGMWGSGYQLQMFIMTPFFPLGSLNRFLARNTVSWEQACRVIHSVSSGVAHLHSETYVTSGGVSVEKYAVAHRDIKSANVLVRGENGDCVISDLGFAMILDPSRDEKDMANTGQVGTYRYMAPEVLDARISLQDIQAFKQIDIYSLGLVMWEVIWRCNVQQEESPRGHLVAYEDRVGQRPGIDAMRDLVCTQKTRPRILPAWRNRPGLSSLVVTIEECWDEDPEARLSASNIILRLKELVDGGPASLASDHTPLHSFPHPPVVPGNLEQFRVSEALESTTDTIGTTDSRPPPYDSRWSYTAPGGPVGDNDGGSSDGSTSVTMGLNSSVTMGLNFEETTV